MRLSYAPLGTAVLLLAGCGADGGGTAADALPGSDRTPGVESVADAYGHSYVGTDVTVAGEPHRLVDGSRIRVGLEQDTIGFDAGCNSMSGEYELDGDRLLVDSVSGTEVGCAQALMDQDDWLAGLMTAGPTVQVDSDRLTLTSGDTVLSLLDVEAAEPDRRLRGTTWVLESYGGSWPDDTVSSLPSGVRSTLRLLRQDIFAAQGCNDAGGTYTLQGGTLQVRDFVSQLKGCDAQRMQVESAVGEVLTSQPSVTVDGDLLTLASDAGTLTYRAG